MALTSTRTIASKTVGMTLDDLRQKFKPSVEVPAIKGVKIGIFGLDGQGKTHMCITPNGDIYAFDIEGEIKLISDKFPEEKRNQLFILDIIEQMKLCGAENIKPVLEYVETESKNLVEVAKNNPDYKATIVIDSDTDLYIKYNNWLEQQTDISRTKIGKPQRLEYQRISRPQQEMFDNLKLTGWNVVVTARARPSYDNSGQADLNNMIPYWYPALNGWLDIWGEIKIVAGKQKFIFRKCRYSHSLIGDVIDDPTIPKIIDYVVSKTNIKIE